MSVIIGAGLSGPRTALLLHAQGVDVLVVEAQGRVGGGTLKVQLVPEPSTVALQAGLLIAVVYARRRIRMFSA